ncbi:MAG: hypothetical protein NC114_08845 [Ruminococcus flavefaciens]|nr:hypothetical protein [Ruminococcus flavefaciens]
MKILELYRKGFDSAVEELIEERDDITTYDTLKEFIISKINDDNLIVALHVLQALDDCYAIYYKYDYSMGTLSTPTPLFEEADLEEFCDGKAYTVDAHINSLDGGMDEITILEERQQGNQKYYIAKYKDIFCTAIFNGFTCSYYADDKYGVIEA